MAGSYQPNHVMILQKEAYRGKWEDNKELTGLVGGSVVLVMDFSDTWNPWRDTMTFDPTSNLITRDVSFTTTEVAGVQYEIVKVFLRHPQEQRSFSGAKEDLLEIKSEAH